MTKRTVAVTVALFFLALASAVAQDVRYNFDKDTDFSKFKTYKWVALKDAQKVNDLVDKQIKDAFDQALATKGLSKTDSDDADLFIAYQPGMKQETEFSSYNSSWGYGPGWYGGGWYGAPSSSMTTGQTSTIYIGQLVLDMYDSAHKDLVWRGVASKSINPKAKPDKQTKNLNKAVAKMLKNYPPPQKKS